MQIKTLKPTMSWIVDDSDKNIRTKSLPLQLPMTQDDEQYLAKMISYIDASYNNEYEKYNIRPGVAIASIQVGWKKRVIYLHFDDEFGIEHRWCLANPEIIEKSNDITYLENGEGCLSVPIDHNGIVPRHNKITIKAYDLLNDDDITLTLTGFSAIVVQHEIDHLDGILYYDRFNPLDPYYSKNDWKKI